MDSFFAHLRHGIPGRVEAGCITLCFVPRPEEAALGGLLPALDEILTFPGSITFSFQPFLLVQINWLTLNQSKDKVGGGCRIGLFVQSRVERGDKCQRQLGPHMCSWTPHTPHMCSCFCFADVRLTNCRCVPPPAKKV